MRLDPWSVEERSPTDQAQAIAWAQNHHVTPRTNVSVRWPGCKAYEEIESLPYVISRCVLAGAMRIPGAVGAETGIGINRWATRIYGEIETTGLPGLLEQTILAEFTDPENHRGINFGRTDELMVGPLSDREYRLEEIGIRYRKYVAWRL
jgi:hypothetical protein